jgi:hypothetical protein
MNWNLCWQTGLCIVLCAAPLAADELIVATSGAAGTYPNVAAAMEAAALGDRILVEPGAYPSFHYVKGVPVIGTGASASDVLIARCDFHPNIPNHDFDALLANLTLGSGAQQDAIALSGNELASGVLVMERVIVNGGVFLSGGPGNFQLVMSNSRVEAGPGQGFAGAAAYFGGQGNFVDIRASLIRAWDASSALGTTAGIGMRVRPGTLVRIANSAIHAGHGSDAGSAFANGASGIAMGFGGGTASVQLAGGALVQGGAGGIGGAGGHGVDLLGTVKLAGATVNGGAGSPAGQPFSSSAVPVQLPLAIALELLPDQRYAQAPALQSGATLAIELLSPPQQSFLALSTGLNAPAAGLASPLQLASTWIVAGGAFTATVPASPSGAPIPSFMLYAQGAAFDFSTGQMHLSEATSIALDLH